MMSQWEEIVELSEEIETEIADKLLKEADKRQDMIGEVCPYPRVEAKRGLHELEAGDLLVQEIDRVPSTENVPRAVEDEGGAKVCHSGGARYRIFPEKQ